MGATAMTTELTVLAWSVILLLVTIVFQAAVTTSSVGLDYNVSNRDEGRQPASVTAQRAKRALANFLETYPAFIALALALAVTGKSGGIGATGALVWIVGRALFFPIYVVGIPFVRTLAWAASIVGLVMMLVRLMG